MFDLALYAAHLGRWDRALDRRPMTWLDRWLVRRSLRRRYRALGLRAPRGVFMSSPLAAAIAAGVAAGVRWLQRNPGTHAALFGRPLDAATLDDAVAATVAKVTGELIPAPAPGPIVAAIREVTAGPPRFARAAAFPFEIVEMAPSLAADDGSVDARLLVAPLEELADRSSAYRILMHSRFAALPQAIDGALGRLPCPSTFLGRTLSAWLRLRVSYARQVSAAVIASFVHETLVKRETLDALRVIHRAGPVFAHAEFWIAADRPQATARDEAGRRHQLDRPAVVWRDGAGLGFVHGIHVDMSVFRRRPALSDVLATRNVELRRVLIQFYERGDPGAFIRDADADTIALDYDRHGNQRQLLRFPLPGDEPYVAVQVINSTPEPDGSHKRYILRVPPTITSCRAAVAWTFGMAADDYDPDVET